MLDEYECWVCVSVLVLVQIYVFITYLYILFEMKFERGSQIIKNQIDSSRKKRAYLMHLSHSPTASVCECTV